MGRVPLEASSRSLRGKNAKQLRADGWIPAVVYGPDIQTQSLQIAERALYGALQQAGSTTLIELQVGVNAKPQVVLAREIQRDPLSNRLIHVDFYGLRLTERVKTMPRIELAGESPLVKSGEAVLIQAMNEVEVECLPTDLVNFIEVDISGLESLDDSILVKDLQVAEGMAVLADPNDVVVNLVPPRKAEEEEVEELEILEEEAEEAEESEELAQEE
jgi:large subunit ribosomal protein L25